MKTTRNKASRSLNSSDARESRVKLPRETTQSRREIRRETVHRQGHTK